MNHATQFIKLAQIDKEAFHYKGHYVSDNKLFEYHQANRPLVGYVPTPGTRNVWEQHKEMSPDHPDFKTVLSSGASSGVDDARSNFQRARDKRRNVVIGVSAAGAAAASIAVPLMFKKVRSSIFKGTANILKKKGIMKTAYAVDYVNNLRMEKSAGNLGKAMLKNPVSAMWGMGSHVIGPKQAAEAARINALRPSAIEDAFKPEISRLTSQQDLALQAHRRLSNKVYNLQQRQAKPRFLDKHLFDRHGERVATKLERTNRQYNKNFTRMQDTSGALASKRNEMGEAINKAAPEYEKGRAGFKNYMKKTEFQRKALNFAGRTALIGTGGAAVYGGSKLVGSQQPQYQPAQQSQY